MLKHKIEQFFAILKLLIARLASYLFCYKLYKKDIWLIMEKKTEARDNGYHFFKYLRENHPEIPAYYVITKDSADYHKIEKYGNIIIHNSWKHFLYSICAKMSISSQPGGATPEPKAALNKFVFLHRKDQRVVNLRHGIVKDELSHLFDYKISKYSLLVCSAERERQFIQTTYKYPDGIVKKLGICRLDNLVKNGKTPQKQILVMPTFRSWLVASDRAREATNTEKESFVKSEYFLAYCRLLSDKRLTEAIRRCGYSMVFYLHYSMQSFVHCFDDLNSDVVTIADRMNYDVQQLMIDSAVMVTDFSSVFFDFAYMEKPEIFFQFDEEQYRSNHYKEGYFDYRRDGFGPVVQTVDEVVDYLIQMMESNCEMEACYVERVRGFFDQRDGKNCERTYQAIMEILQGEKNGQRRKSGL